MALTDGASLVLDYGGYVTGCHSGSQLAKLASGAAAWVSDPAGRSVQFLVCDACRKHSCAQEQLNLAETEVSESLVPTE